MRSPLDPTMGELKSVHNSQANLSEIDFNITLQFTCLSPKRSLPLEFSEHNYVFGIIYYIHFLSLYNAENKSTTFRGQDRNPSSGCQACPTNLVALFSTSQNWPFQV